MSAPVSAPAEAAEAAVVGQNDRLALAVGVAVASTVISSSPQTTTTVDAVATVGAATV